jgi:hypothetical protein
MVPAYPNVGEVRDCCTLHARSPGHAFKRIANLMGIARQVPAHDAYIVTAESLGFIVQIHIIREVRG